MARAELVALGEALRRTSGPVVVFSDCKYVVDGLNAGLRKRTSRGSRHADVWDATQKEAMGRSTTLTWVKAHVTTVEDYIKYGSAPEMVIGNAAASALAKRGRPRNRPQRTPQCLGSCGLGCEDTYAVAGY